MVAHLKRNNSSIVPRRIGHDIGKVPVQEQQYSVDFLSLSNDDTSDESTGKRSLKRKTSYFASRKV